MIVDGKIMNLKYSGLMDSSRCGCFRQVPIIIIIASNPDSNELAPIKYDVSVDILLQRGNVLRLRLLACDEIELD